MQLANIAGNRTRLSMFQNSAVDLFQASRMAGHRMGQTGQAIYARAKAALSKFDMLVERTKRIANKAARAEIIDTYGLQDAGNKNKALYYRNAVHGDVVRVEDNVPPNYWVYETRKGPAVGYVDTLESWNRSFAADVQEAEDVGGILPEPIVIERLVQVPGEAPQTPDWVLPLAVVGGVIAIASLVSYFNK